jgi:hypothetical protein
VETVARGTARRRHGATFVVAAAIVAAAIAAAPVIAYELSRGTGGTRAALPPLVTESGLVERSGVRVVRVAVTGDGGLVDLRFLVVDADKAAAVHERQPLLVDERTGGVIDRPWMGHVHTHGLKLGVGYYVLFENVGSLIRPGSLVTVQLGDARLPHVRVQ